MLKVKVEQIDPLTHSTVTAPNGFVTDEGLQLVKPLDPGGEDGAPMGSTLNEDHQDRKEGGFTMVSNQEEAPYTIEESQGETTEVPLNDGSAVAMETSTAGDVVIQEESPVMVMSSSENQDGLGVQEVVEVPYLQGPSGGVIVLEEEGTTQYIVTDGNTEYLTEEVNESSGLLHEDPIPLEADSSQQLGMFEQVVPTDHVVVERIQYHEVPFIPPNVGGDAVVLHQEDDNSDGDEDGNQHPGLRSDGRVSLNTESKMLYALQQSEELDLQEATISGQTRALLIQRLAGRLQYEKMDIVPAEQEKPNTDNVKLKVPKKSKRKNSGGAISDKGAKKKKVAKTDIGSGTAVMPGQLVIPTLGTSVNDNVRLKPVSPVALTIPSVPKVKQLSPIQRRHPTVVSLLNSKIPLPRSSIVTPVVDTPTDLAPPVILTSPAIVPYVPGSSAQVQSPISLVSPVQLQSRPAPALTTITVPTPPNSQPAVKQMKKPAILGKAKLPTTTIATPTTAVSAITSVIQSPILIPSVSSAVSPVILAAGTGQIVGVSSSSLIIPQPVTLASGLLNTRQPPPYPSSRETTTATVQAISTAAVSSVVSPPPYPHSRHTQLNIPKITPKIAPKGTTKKSKKRTNAKSQPPSDKLKTLLPQDLSIPRITPLDDDLRSVKVIPKALPNASRLQRQLDELNDIEENLRELHQGGEIDLSLKKKYHKINLNSKKNVSTCKTPAVPAASAPVSSEKAKSDSTSQMHELKARLTFKIRPIQGLDSSPSLGSASDIQESPQPSIKFTTLTTNSIGATDPNMTLADKYMKDWKQTGKFCCKFCHYSSVTQNFLFRHWVMNHSGLRPYMCTYCSLRAPTRDAVMRHQATAHRDSERQILVDNTAERMLVKRFNEVFDQKTIAGFPDSEHNLSLLLPTGVEVGDLHQADSADDCASSTHDGERTWLYRPRLSEGNSGGDNGLGLEENHAITVSENEQLRISTSQSQSSDALTPAVTTVMSPPIVRYKLETVDGVNPSSVLFNNNPPLLPVLSSEGNTIPFVMSASQLLTQMKDTALNLQVITSSPVSNNTLSTSDVSSPLSTALPTTQIRVESRTLPSIVIPSSPIINTLMSPSKILVSPALSKLPPSVSEHASLPVSAVSPEAAANARMTIYNLLERAILTSYSGEPPGVQTQQSASNTKDGSTVESSNTKSGAKQNLIDDSSEAIAGSMAMPENMSEATQKNAVSQSGSNHGSAEKAGAVTDTTCPQVTEVVTMSRSTDKPAALTEIILPRTCSAEERPVNESIVSAAELSPPVSSSRTVITDSDPWLAKVADTTVCEVSPAVSEAAGDTNTS